MQIVVDADEDRDDEQQHEGEDQRGKGDHHCRVDHRASDAALELRLLLDLHRRPIEYVAERPRRLARLDQRDVEAMKTFGCCANAVERTMPPSTSERISAITSRRYLSSVCSSSVTSAATTLTPASIIVASWRKKTWSDFALTFLSAVRAPASFWRSTTVCASSPCDRSCSCAEMTSAAWISPLSWSPSALIAS